jgi:ABC-type dipeptide/oligopeptide/nickel transport system permease component
MAAYIARRLLLAVPTAWGVATAVFFLLHLIPGNPAALMLGEGARGEDVAALEARLGLDEPLAAQYGKFLLRTLRGDFGVSFRYEAPVAALILEKLPATAELAGASFLFAVALAFAMGLVSAARRGGPADYTTLGFSLACISFPTFGLGPLLLYAFSLRLDLFPVSGRGTLLHLVLPAVTLGLAFAAVLGRLLRASLLEALSDDYIRTARAKGLPHTAVFLRHALRNALLPAVTLMGLQLGHLFTGAIITETIFSWPGVGRLLFQSIQFRDYPAVQGIVLFMALVYICVNLATDLTYAVLDPRLRKAS